MKKTPLLKVVRYGLETVIVYLVYGFFALFPLAVASDMGGFVMRHIGPCLGLSKKARRNLERAFPEKPPAKIQKIIVGMWDNLGRVVAEYPHLDDIWKATQIQGHEYIEQMKNDGKAGIMVGGHLANWEVPPIAIKQAGLSFAVVYRKPNNPWVENLLCKARSSGTAEHIPKGAEGARAMIALIKNGGHLGMLIDQKLNEGIPVPFFGREAMTAPAVASFALKFDFPVHPMRVERLGGAQFKVTVFPALDIAALGDNYKIMLKINELLESWIRERPEQWLWIHRRWPS